MEDQAAFYDRIAEYYDLIYADWEASMRRQGAAIAASLGPAPSDTRILDVTAGIGTQALPLASLGYEVVARDLSEGAIRRLRHEASERGLEIDAACSDVRDVGRAVEGRFDAVISFDNSLPHLLTDDEIRATLVGLRELLTPCGVILISVRDYENVDRSAASVHPYGERVRSGSRYRVGQRWTWYDATHYHATMTVERWEGADWAELVRTTAAYYAIPIPRLLELMREAGLRATRLDGLDFFQPVLRGVPDDR